MLGVALIQNASLLIGIRKRQNERKTKTNQEAKTCRANIGDGLVVI
jgi:hypothetical protein